MGKYDLEAIVKDIQKLYPKDGKSSLKLGTGFRKSEDADHVLMPKWFQDGTNTKGIPYGKYVLIAGDSDSGKTSCAISAMKAAQEQEVAVLYVETEGKTTEKDLVGWGVDPKGVMLIQSCIVEEIDKELTKLWDGFFTKYPKGQLLLIVDSFGNIITRRDATLDLTNSNQKPGGKGAVNRLILNKLIAKASEKNIAMLLLSYTYDNIGSTGKTNAGGKALNFFSSLSYQTSRKSWIEATIKGQKVRRGARVRWKLFKNHVDRANPGPKVIELDITKDGITLVGSIADE